MRNVLTRERANISLHPHFCVDIANQGADVEECFFNFFHSAKYSQLVFRPTARRNDHFMIGVRCEAIFQQKPAVIKSFKHFFFASAEWAFYWVSPNGQLPWPIQPYSCSCSSIKHFQSAGIYPPGIFSDYTFRHERFLLFPN